MSACWDGFPPPERDEDLGPWEAVDETWRGDIHLGAWPENLAGPEYWLWKRKRDEEEG